MKRCFPCWTMREAKPTCSAVLRTEAVCQQRDRPRPAGRPGFDRARLSDNLSRTRLS
jgi:hypothetical protein